jgi:hypothetical protein
MHLDLGEIYGDPRIFENPIEAGIELADVSRKRVPGLWRRSMLLLLFAIFWTIAMTLLLVQSAWMLLVWFLSSDPISMAEVLIILSVLILLIPSIGLGITLLLLAVQERSFLPYLEQVSMAMTALGERPSIKRTPVGQHEVEEDDDERADENSIVGILGSAMWVGNLVPVVGRMTVVARAILGIVLLGLSYLVAGALFTLVMGDYALFHILLQIVVFAVFVGPGVLLFQWLSRDHDFYSYYGQRHLALEEVGALGIPPVPEGRSNLSRFDRFLKVNHVVRDMLSSEGGGVQKDVGRKGHRFSRFYHGTLHNQRVGILVSMTERAPSTDDLDILLEEAKIFGEREGAHISRVVALVTGDVKDISDDVYDHLITQGRRTRPGDCALQLVMEVEGLYSIVPYVAM